jgi:hypothetical protein
MTDDFSESQPSICIPRVFIKHLSTLKHINLDKPTEKSINEQTPLIQTDEFEYHYVPKLKNLLRKCCIYSKCYLRVFDGLQGEYKDAMGEMVLHNAVISISTFKTVLKSAGLKVTFGSTSAGILAGSQLIKIEENISGTSSPNIVVHEIELNESRGRIRSRYYIFKSGPLYFREESINIAILE